MNSGLRQLIKSCLYLGAWVYFNSIFQAKVEDGKIGNHMPGKKIISEKSGDLCHPDHALLSPKT